MVKRLEKVKRGAPFLIKVDEELAKAYFGETLATVILASGKKVISRSSRTNSPRSYFCGVGICNECLITLEDGRKVRACQTLASANMKIRTC